MSVRFSNPRGRRGALCLLLWLAAIIRASGADFDSGMTPVEFLERAVQRVPGFAEGGGRWIRVRGLAEATDSGAQRAALTELRQRGYNLCALLIWDRTPWSGGVRAGGPRDRRLPVDLREAHERCRALVERYAGLVDLWEIGNEPDISYVEENAETYAAFLKACERGLHAGVRASAKRTGETLRHPLVGMAPLAQPPGPYFRRLWANGASAYTDVLNFHYYGYAEDFSDVYRQFNDAMDASGDARETPPDRQLPVIVTEYGYGLLAPRERNDAAARLRQMRWFRDVRAQQRQLPLAVAMAFVVMPYQEAARSEFGLLMETASASRWVASPALEALLDEERPPANISDRMPRAWLARDVVIDFIAGEGLTERKSFGGYFVDGFSATEQSVGSGHLVIYNFGPEKVAGELTIDGGGMRRVEIVGEKAPLELAPGERRVLPLLFASEETGLHERLVTATFTAKTFAGPAAAQWQSAFFPDPAQLRREVVADFSHVAEAAEAQRKILLTRPLAQEEPRLAPAGRWLVTEGVRVDEAGGSWRFHVDRFPDQPSRPAMAELPLPADFRLQADQLLSFAYRAEVPSGEKSGGRLFEVYVRAANGNLYHVWPRLDAASAWRHYAERGGNYTMAFFGRAKNPWRFLDNTPASLVFFFRPEVLPAVYEIKDAAVVTLTAP
jgi:hypothetical protein